MKKGLFPVIILAVLACLFAALMPTLGLDYTWDEILGGIDSTQVDYSLYSENFEKIIGKGETVDISALAIERTANNETELIPVTEDMIVYMDSSDSIGYKKVIVKYLEEEYTLHFEVRYRVDIAIDGEIVDSQLVKSPEDITLPSANDEITENWNILMPDDINDNFTINSPLSSMIPPLYKTGAAYGDMLAELALPSNEHGAWVLKNSEGTVGDAGYHEFEAVFIWKDASREPKDGIIALEVKKLKIEFTDTVTSFIYDGGAHFPTYKVPEGISVTEIGNDGAVDSGSYEFMLIIDDPNREGELSGSFTIEKAPVTVTVKDASLVYGNTASFIPEYTVSGFDSADLLGISVSLPTEFNAGTYTMSALSSNENIILTVNPGTLTVDKATFDPGTPALDKSTAEFEDKLSSISFLHHPGGVWTWLTPDSEVGSVGEKTFCAKFTPNNKNYYDYETEVAVTVVKRNLTITVENTTFVYNTSARTLNYTLTDKNGKVYEGLFVAGNDPKTNAGVYDMNLTVSDSSYTGSTSVKMTIIKAMPNADFSFITEGVWRDGIKLSDITLPAGYTWSDPASPITGAGTASFGATFTPADTANYETENGTLTVSLDKASASIEGLLPSYTFTYNKGAHSITGIVPSHTESEITVSYKINGETADSIIGAGSYTVTVTLPETANYKEATVTATVTVLAADNTDEVTTAQNAIFGDPLSVISLPTSPDGIWSIKENVSTVGNVGTKTFTALFTPASANYNSREVAITLTVAKKSVPVPAAASKIYTGSTLSSGITATELYTVSSEETGADVGKYSLTLRLTDSANYKWASTDSDSVTVVFEITKATNLWQTAPSVSGGVYGDGVIISAEAKFGEYSVLYKAEGEGDESYSAATPTNAGNYVALFTSTSTNASVITKEVPFTIQKKAVPVPSAESSTYTGERLYSGLSTNSLYTVYDEGGINVTEEGYGVTLTLIDTKNYKWDDSLDGTVRALTYYITKATVSINTDLAIDGWTFGETASTPTATKNSDLGNITYLYSSDNITYTATAPTAAGTYYVKAVVNGTANYNGDESEPITFTIGKATPNVVGVKDTYSAVYSGTAYDHTAIGAPSYTGGVLSYYITKNGTAVTEIKGAGTYTVTVTLTESDNYVSVYTVTTVTVAAADNTDEINAAQSATFGDSISVITLPVSPNGIWSIKESVSTVGAAGTKTFTALFTPSTENYNSREVTITLTVAKKTVSVPTVSNKTYTGTHLDSGLTATDDYTVTLDEGGIAEGTYSVILTLTDSANFKWASTDSDFVTVSYQIAKAVNNWINEPSISGWTFGDEANAGSASVEHGGVLIEYRENKDGAEFSTAIPENAGSYIARFTSTDTLHTPLVKEIPFTVSPAKVSVPTLGTTEFTYNGTTTFYSGLTDTDSYTVEDSGSLNAATVTVTLTLKSTNYVWANGDGTVRTLTYTVKPASVTLTGFTASGTVYGESLPAPSVSADISCMVVYKYATSANGEYTETVPTAAGTYFVKACVVASENILPGESAPISFTITKAAASISGYNDSYETVYTGNPFAHTALGIVGSHNEGDLQFTVTKGGTEVDAIVDAGSYTVTVTLESNNYETATATFTVTVLKADNTDTIPTYNATYLDKLSTLALPTSATGVWSWKNADASVGAAGTNTHIAVFTPYNSSNYNSREVSVTVNVAVKVLTVPSSGNSVYTGDRLYSGISTAATYTVADDGGVDIGIYYAYVTLADSANYKWAGTDDATVSVSYKITVATNEWTTVPDVPDIFFGDTISTSGEAKFGEYEILYKQRGADDSEYSSLAPTEAGDYVALFTSTNANASILTKAVEFAINPAPVSLPTGAAGSKVYTGEKLYSGFTSNTYYTVSDPGRTDVGSYTYTYTLTSTNYVWADGHADAERSVTFTITRAQSAFTAFTVEGWIYGESSKVSASASFGVPYYLYSATSDGTYTETVPTEPGTYFVKAVVLEHANYYGAEIGPRSFVIAKATPTVTAPTYPDGTLYLNLVDLSKDYISAPTASVAGTFSYSAITFKDGGSTYDLIFTPTDSVHYNTVTVKAAIVLKTVAVVYTSSALTDAKSYHGTIEDAIRSAVSGDVILVTPDASGNLYITENITISSGVTLILPYGEYSTSLADVYNQKNSNGHYEATKYGKTFETTAETCTTLVTVKSGVTITSNGNIIIAGILTGGNAGYDCGVTAGAHARLSLETDAALVLNSGSNTDCLGYIVDAQGGEGGSVTLKDGATMLQPFAIFDFRGGSFMYAVYSKRDTYGICPFSEYAVKNVESLLTIESDGLLKTVVNMYAGDQQNATTINLVGNVSSASLIQLTSADSYLTSKYSAEKNQIDLDIYGGAQSGSMSMTLSLGSLPIIGDINISVKTTEYYFPIPHLYDISLNTLPGKDSASYTMDQRFLFRGGSVFTVGEGVTLTANEIAVVDEADIIDITYGADPYGDMGAGLFTVNGTLIVNKLAGDIRTEVDGATVTVKSSVSITLYFAYGSAISGSSLSASLDKVQKIDHVARLVYGNTVYAKVETKVSEGGKWPVVTTAISIGGDGFDFTVTGNIYDADGNLIATGYDSRTEERRSEFFVDEGAIVNFIGLPASRGVFINGSFVNTAGAGNIYKGGDVEWIVSNGDTCEVKTMAVISSITNSASATVTITYNSDGTITIAASKKGGAFATCSLKISASVSGKSDSDSKWSLTGYTAKVEITIPAGTVGETVTITT